jgi:O-antigen ligase
MSVFTGKLLWQSFSPNSPRPYWSNIKKFPAWQAFGLLAAFVIIALINGFWRGHSLSLIFSDFNAWLYFFLVGPIIAIYGDSDKKKISRLQDIFLAGAIWLSLKTLILLFIFTHNYSFASDIYLWLRKTLVGEMTPTKTGWPRIFIQGQIFSAIAFFLIFWLNQTGFKIKEFFCRQNLARLSGAALFLSSVLISFSRSFWVALIGVALVSLLLIWRLASFKKMLLSALWLIISGIFSFALIYLVVAFPYWHTPASDFSSNFLERVSNSNEAALASRWSLLPVLFQKIMKEPWLGQGYGATVTYFSRDPRILENNPSGEYTTYAFEWGYLDLWLKLGLLGLAAYLFLLFKLLVAGAALAYQENNYLFFGLSAGVLFLIITNFFTPYLNHPLGIGFLLLSSCFIWANKVY